MSTNQTVKISEAANILDIKPHKVKSLIAKGYIDLIDGFKPKRVSLDSVMETKELLKTMNGSIPLRFINNIFQTPMVLLDFRGGFYHSQKNPDPEMLITNGRYGVTQDGKVINLFRGVLIRPQTVDHDYKQIVLRGIHANRICLMLHRVVAFAWCPNGRFASEVHHIDGHRDNNHFENLIWLFPDEHNKAHDLLKQAKNTNDWNDYNIFISDLKTLNQWTDEQRSKGIRWLHGSFNNPDYIHLFYVTEDTYVRLENENKTIEEIDNPEIWWEYHIPLQKEGN